MLVAHARDRIKQQQVRQWPDAGGPSGRLPFSLEEPPEPERLPLVRRDGRFVVPGGAVFGLGIEDSVSMVFPGGQQRTAAGVLRSGDRGRDEGGGRAAAYAAVRRCPGPPAGDCSRRRFRPARTRFAVRVHDRRHVLIDARDLFAEALRKELARCPRLAETEDERDAFATVRATEPGRAKC